MRSLLLLFTSFVVLTGALLAQERTRRPREAAPAPTPTSVSATPPAMMSARQQLDWQIAAQFAPIIHQALGDNPRADYLAAFDFDGDWRGDNNWYNLDKREFKLRGTVYYSVTETATHYFVLYAFFHPRDYKGGVVTSTILSSVLRETLPRVGKDPTGKADDIALSHENDLEGALVVAAKNQSLAQARVQFVETLAHNVYLKYRAADVASSVGDVIELNGARPLLYIEAKGHGVYRWTGDAAQLNRKVTGVLIYSHDGATEEPAANDKTAGYVLAPVFDTLWTRAQQGENPTYGETLDYQTRTVPRLLPEQKTAAVEQKLGALGVSFRGVVGFKNKARPPWGWFDDAERDRPAGEWFFDPAAAVGRHFSLGQDWSLTYVYHPYFKIE